MKNMNAPYKDRANFFKYQSAGICFGMVRDISAFFLYTRPHRREKIHDPLLVALHVLYGRPFKQRTPLRLESTIVPAAYRPLHDKLITLRDKMHAHTDIDGPEVIDGMGLNDLTGYTTKGRTTFGISVFNPNENMHNAVVHLSQRLKAETDRLATAIWEKYMREQKVPDGVTMVNMASADGPFLVAHPGNDTDEFDKYFVDVAEFKNRCQTKPRTLSVTRDRPPKGEG